jgi:hypothetical protein
METKVCSKCKVEQAVSEFYIAAKTKDGLRSDCKICQNKAATKYRNTTKGQEKSKAYQQNPENKEKANLLRRERRLKTAGYKTNEERQEQRQAQRREQRREHCNSEESIKLRRERERSYRYKAAYGITLEEYDKMFEAQKGLCWICGNPQRSKLSEHLCVDHNHETGEVRGLLCHTCNTTLGSYEMSKTWYEASKDKINSYLSK